MHIYDDIDRLRSEIEGRRPLDAGLIQQIGEYYRIGLTWSSNALEGNSLTETETKVVLEDGITIGGKPLRDHLEAIGHAEAFNHLRELVKKKTISERDILRLHELFYHRIDRTNAGKYRTVKVFLTGSAHTLPPPEDVPRLMKGFIPRLRAHARRLHPVDHAALAHKEFVFIHPFVDGNGRVARLIMNLILAGSGYPVTIIPPVLRSEYIASLERAHEDDGPFRTFIARLVREAEKDYLRLFG